MLLKPPIDADAECNDTDWILTKTQSRNFVAPDSKMTTFRRDHRIASANAGQGIASEPIEDAAPTQTGGHLNHGASIIDRFSNNRSVRPKRVTLHRSQQPICICGAQMATSLPSLAT